MIRAGGAIGLIDCFGVGLESISNNTSSFSCSRRLPITVESSLSARAEPSLTVDGTIIGKRRFRPVRELRAITRLKNKLTYAVTDVAALEAVGELAFCAA